MATPEKREMELEPKYDDYDYPITAPEPRDGHPGYLTEQQQAQVHQLRLMLEAQGFKERLDTLTLLRFLRARKFDVNLSFQMFVDCEKWRKDTKLDEELPNWEYPEKKALFQYYPQYYHKTDKVRESDRLGFCTLPRVGAPGSRQYPWLTLFPTPLQDGRPVYIEQLGSIDLTAMYKITTAERMLTNLAVEYERVSDPRLPACSRKAGHLLETCCTIMDLKGVGLTKAPQVYGYVRQASAMSQNYYPERLGRLYVINAPWGFSTVWSMIKGWLDPVTVQKIHILGSGYQKELLAQVPPENLPKEFGGTCACAEGCENSDAGPWHDEQWAREPKWAKKGDASTTIQGAPSEVQEGKAAAEGAAAAPAPAEDVAGAKATA